MPLVSARVTTCQKQIGSTSRLVIWRESQFVHGLIGFIINSSLTKSLSYQKSDSKFLRICRGWTTMTVSKQPVDAMLNVRWRLLSNSLDDHVCSKINAKLNTSEGQSVCFIDRIYIDKIAIVKTLLQSLDFLGFHLHEAEFLCRCWGS